MTQRRENDQQYLMGNVSLLWSANPWDKLLIIRGYILFFLEGMMLKLKWTEHSLFNIFSDLGQSEFRETKGRKKSKFGFEKKNVKTGHLWTLNQDKLP